jgi:hypothetical protein
MTGAARSYDPYEGGCPYKRHGAAALADRRVPQFLIAASQTSANWLLRGGGVSPMWPAPRMHSCSVFSSGSRSAAASQQVRETSLPAPLICRSSATRVAARRMRT